MKKVSVIVPVYNVEQYLRKCLDGLVNQTLKEIEILVINDGTKDDSYKIMQEYADRYENIKIFSKENGGLSDTRNYGMKHASGEYVGFVDSDDFVETNMYETLYNKAKENHSDMVECNFYHNYPDSQSVEIGVKYQNKEDMIMLGRSVVWNKIYRRDWLEKTGIQFPVGLNNEDVEFYEKLMVHAERIDYVDGAFVHYVQRESSLNHEASLRMLQVLEVLQHIIDYYKEQGVYETYHDALEFFCARIILCSSFDRLTGIPDANERKYALQKNWDMLEKSFPNWKKNKYLKTKKGMKVMYMRYINKTLYRIFGCFRHLMKNGRK